jgi:hypothetical protein
VSTGIYRFVLFVRFGDACFGNPFVGVRAKSRASALLNPFGAGIVPWATPLMNFC